MSRPEASLSQRVASAVPAAGALALAVLVLALLAPSLALASSSLVFSSADLTALGLRPAPTSVSSARGQLVAGLPASVVASLDGALIRASAASTSGQRLGSYAFVLRSTSAARRVLTSWRTVHHAKGVAIGAGGAVAVQSSTNRALVQVLWRNGARLGLIVLSDTSQTSAARDVAVSYAMLAEGFLVAPLPTTAWGKVLDQIRPNGTVSMATALQAVALTFGALPGVRVPSGPRTTVESGDLAAAWVLPYLPQLSRQMQRAVYRDLGLTPPGTTARTASYGDPGFTVDASMTADANHWAAVYAGPGYLNHALTLQIEAGRTTTDLGTDAANAYPVDANGKYTPAPVDANGKHIPAGPYCRIRVAMDTPASTLQHVLAHEVFHCEEFDLDHNWPAAGAWVIEGMAEWAAQTVSPSSSYLFELDQYVESSDTKLFTRTYDAEGFWGHVQDSVAGGLWPRVSEVLNSTGPDARFADAGATAYSFLSTWGSSFFNDPSHAPEWDMVSPVKTSAHSSFTPIDAAIDATVLVLPYSTSQYVVDNTDPSATLLHVQIPGYARLGLKQNYTDLHDAWFCTSGTCVCPLDTTGTPPPTQPLTLPSALALTASSEFVRGTIVVASLDDYCKSGPATGPTGLLAEEPCLGLFSLGDFPGATSVQSGTTGPLSTCVYGDYAGPPPIAGEVSLDTLPTVADAHTLFVRITANSAPLHGIGDEAAGGPVVETPTTGGTTYPGWRGVERVDNDILIVATYPGTAASVETLLARGDAALRSKSP